MIENLFLDEYYRFLNLFVIFIVVKDVEKILVFEGLLFRRIYLLFIVNFEFENF